MPGVDRVEAERAAQGGLARGVPAFGRIAPEDVPALMAIERLPGYDTLVGRWEAAKHEAELAHPGTRYFALRAGGRLAGFAIVHLDDPDRRAHLKRIAVAEPGRGDGGRLLRGLIDQLFTETETNRLDLDVFEDNHRAMRAYVKAGFTAEGLLREYHRMADGSFRGIWLMSLLRREWLAAQGGGLNPGPART
jgi:RimJ/RimL family protein N-acetyltransferase